MIRLAFVVLILALIAVVVGRDVQIRTIDTRQQENIEDITEFRDVFCDLVVEPLSSPLPDGAPEELVKMRERTRVAAVRLKCI